jgi:hypothetical protein
VRKGVVTRATFWRAWSIWAVSLALTATTIAATYVHPLPAGLANFSGSRLNGAVAIVFIGIFKVLAAGGALLFVVTGLAAVLSLVFRYRKAQAAERAQLRWLIYAGALILVAVVASALIQPVTGASDSANNLSNALSSGAVALVPVAIGVAVLRYRLYDIDRIISRTVAYAIVTGLLVGVYGGSVLLATGVLRFRTPVAVAAATLAAAALFTPVRRRVQSRVDRRFNRARYDADQIAAAFAARLKDTVDLSTVRDDLTGVVSRALEPAHVSVWISRPQDRSSS